MSSDSRARDIERYSFLYALANDDIISESELDFMLKLALEDSIIDAEEKAVFCRLLERVNRSNASEELKQTLDEFSGKLGC